MDNLNIIKKNLNNQEKFAEVSIINRFQMYVNANNKIYSQSLLRVNRPGCFSSLIYDSYVIAESVQ